MFENEEHEANLIHRDMVRVLAKPGEEILKALTPEAVGMWHMATGISGEAGELIDAIKKYVAYNKDLDRNNVIEELGDLEFYMEGLRQLINVSRAEVLEKNFSKLNVRYQGMKYSDTAAQARADKPAGE